MTEERIDAGFRCNQCGVSSKEVPVPARKNPTDDLIGWVNQEVVPRLYHAHRFRSPECPATTVEIWFPFTDNTEWVGQYKPKPQEGTQPCESKTLPA